MACPKPGHHWRVRKLSIVAAFGHYAFGLKWASGVLLGAVVSSTDAAAVFGALRAKNTNLKPGLRHLIEAESGSNDPMAVFLTFAAITAVLVPQTSVVTHIGHFFLEIGLGAALGYLGGKCSAYIINHIRLEWEGLYPVLSIALVLLFFAICSRIGGNGFLGVYVAGLVVGNTTLIHRRSLLMFHDGIPPCAVKLTTEPLERRTNPASSGSSRKVLIPARRPS